MQNFMILDSEHIQTAFGIFAGVVGYSTFSSGEIQSLSLSERNMVMSEVGELIPAYTENGHRKNKPSVEFDKQGMVVTVALEEQQEIITPIGEMPAELVKFYDSGELHRVFVVDGQIGGFWTEEDERQRNVPLSFDLEVARFYAMLNGICFYKTGDIKSITLYPGERITVQTPIGAVDTEVGFSLYDSGALQSVEPADTVILQTPIGTIAAYDTEQIGINADSNSLTFTEDGQLYSLITCDYSVYVQTEEGVMEKHSPQIKPHPLHDDEFVVSGIKIEFSQENNKILIEEKTYDQEKCGFTLEPFAKPGVYCTPADCASCSLCNK